jgi:capsular exopolysaccharide synthesis family protein
VREFWPPAKVGPSFGRCSVLKPRPSRGDGSFGRSSGVEPGGLAGAAAVARDATDPDQRESTLVTSPSHHLPGPGTPGEPTESRSPSEWLLLLLWRQKWVLLLTLLLAAGGAFAYLRVATQLYTSTAKFSVRQIGTLTFTNSQGGGQPANSATFVSSQMEQIRGDEVLARAAAELQQKYTVKALRDSIDTELDRTTENVAITAKSPDPAEAKRMVEKVYKAFKETRKQLASDESSPERQQQGQYQRQMDQAKADLAAEEAKLRELQGKYGPDVRQDERTSLEYKRYEVLLTEFERAKKVKNEADDAAELAQKALGRQASRPVDPLEEDMGIDISSPEELLNLRNQILQLQAHLQGLQQRFLPEHPAVVAARDQAVRLNRQYLNAVVQRARKANRDFGRLQQDVEQSRAELRKIDLGAIEYRTSRARVEELRTDVKLYDGKIREIQFSGIEVGKPFDGPGLSDRPSLPNPWKVYAVAVTLGLVLGMVLAAGREWLDDRMRSAGEIRTSLGMPLLAVIPQSSTKRSFSVGGQRVLLDPASDAAEAYRSLRTAVQFAAPGGLKTLMIASPNSGDGKTTLTTNLGIAMAQAGKRVCIVDADLRKPTVHDVFSIKTTLGLSTLLAGRSTLDGTLQRTNVPGLDVLPCGPVPANPTEVLNSQEFTDAVEDLADRYDLVLLDSPPVMAANDARVIAASCDATLIVLTARQAHRRSTETTRDALQGVGARIIGLVVNDVPRKGDQGYGAAKSMRHVVPGLTSQEYELLQTRGK